ncbi:hypothetical protein EYF80_039791 [Liparis tanakae]|uniref:Uncharacterized protein n=1 Tax=Liparis tanakae TaxID=230148 RepID=A0A4Z2GAL4_9TELE|nr:hypothetical protein EYF80_039791 [Liparis tanakae]
MSPARSVVSERLADERDALRDATRAARHAAWLHWRGGHVSKPKAFQRSRRLPSALYSPGGRKEVQRVKPNGVLTDHDDREEDAPPGELHGRPYSPLGVSRLNGGARALVKVVACATRWESAAVTRRTRSLNKDTRSALLPAATRTLTPLLTTWTKEFDDNWSITLPLSPQEITHMSFCTWHGNQDASPPLAVSGWRWSGGAEGETAARSPMEIRRASGCRV